jgi:hypothetical protein
MMQKTHVSWKDDLPDLQLLLFAFQFISNNSCQLQNQQIRTTIYMIFKITYRSI